MVGNVNLIRKMSYLSTALTECENLQFRLTEFFQTCGHEMFFEEMAWLEFINSPANNNGLVQEIAPGRGKTRTVNLTYEQRILEGSGKTGQPNPNCSAGTKRGDCVEQYSIDTTENIQHEELIEIEDLEKNCEDNPNFFTRRIMKLVDVMDREIATQTANEAALLTGSWAGDVDNVDAQNNLEVATLKVGTTDEVAPFTYEEINTAALQTGYCAPLVVVGALDLHKYFKRTSMAGCCANQGLDLSAMWGSFGVAYMYDRRVANALGSDRAFVTQPGAITLLRYTRSEWKDGVPAPITNGANYFMTTVVSPRTGLPYDLTVKDDCGNISLVLTGTTKLVGLPDDMFPQGDNYEGVNFLNTVEVVNV